MMERRKVMTPMEKLKNQIYMLKAENNILRERIKELNKGWVHPKSCLHNEDPWKKWG
tara:strand:- start:487 stop:657 length:171 start_codon:yes stop_codon:yes gene_type:complete